MKNQFAEEYARHLEILSKYQSAKSAGDEAGIEAARAAHLALNDDIEAKGAVYARLYARYESAQERGNAFIDCGEVIWDKDVASFVASLREYGIEKFVFSSTWSSAVETAWLLQQNGCRLEGLIEINGGLKRFCSDEYEKIHGYLFTVD